MCHQDLVNGGFLPRINSAGAFPIQILGVAGPHRKGRVKVPRLSRLSPPALASSSSFWASQQAAETKCAINFTIIAEGDVENSGVSSCVPEGLQFNSPHIIVTFSANGK